MRYLSVINVSLERWLLPFFIALIPIQRRMILFQSDWYFNEWRSGFLYGTDIAVLIVVGYALWAGRHELRKFQPGVLEGLFSGLLLVGALSISGSLVPRVGWFYWVKLLEGTLLFYAVRSLSRRTSWELLAWGLVGGALAQSFIAIGQFISQAHLGLSFLGESVLRTDISGVATFPLAGGGKAIRAYGTFPHPNILSTYLLLALFALYGLFLYRVSQFSRWIWFALYAVLLCGFLFTFSRTTIGLWGMISVGLVAIAWQRGHARKAIEIGIATLVIVVSFSLVYWPEVMSRMTLSSEEQAVTLRMYYNKAALGSGGGFNWLGLGLGNFTSWLMQHTPGLARYVYQPAHNIYVLAYAETGILGAFLFCMLIALILWRYIRAARMWGFENWLICAAAGCFLVIGLFDHFPWTLQQGRLMLWTLLGILSVRS